MEIKTIAANPNLTGQVRLIEDIAYGVAEGEALKLSVLAPWLQRDRVNELAPRPLIVFVQGSSWQRPTRGEQIPQLVQFVHQGYTVATIQHRNAIEGHQYPAFLVDVKTAIRYLRAHAAEYAIDPQRVVLWGTSSGGNAALLAGLTGDDPTFKRGAHLDQSDAVKAVVACFAPTDVADTFEYTKDFPGSSLLQLSLFGPDTSQWPEKMAAMSPLSRVQTAGADRTYPAFMLLHGDADQVVPYHEMEDLGQALEAAGASVEAVRIAGANHESDFWSQPVYDAIADFMAAQVHPQTAERK